MSHIYIYIYIYIDREREIKRERDVIIYIYIYKNIVVPLGTDVKLYIDVILFLSVI